MGFLEMKILFSIVAKVHSIAAICCMVPYNNIVGKLLISELYYYNVIFVDIGSKFYQSFNEFVLFWSLQSPN